MRRLGWGLILFLALVTSSAFAAVDVECWDNDCLRKGWSKKDASAPFPLDFQCYRRGCELDGWIAGGRPDTHYYTQCKPGGCFLEGWYEVDRSTQQMLRNVSCYNNDCLIHGWLSSGSSGALVTRCHSNNCRNNGWSSQLPTGGYQIIVCKPKSCFKEGWYENSNDSAWN